MHSRMLFWRAWTRAVSERTCAALANAAQLIPPPEVIPVTPLPDGQLPEAPFPDPLPFPSAATCCDSADSSTGAAPLDSKLNTKSAKSWYQYQDELEFIKPHVKIGRSDIRSILQLSRVLEAPPPQRVVGHAAAFVGAVAAESAVAAGTHACFFMRGLKIG